MNISAITKGFILEFVYEVIPTRHRRGGSSATGKLYGREELEKEISRFQKNEEDIDYIKVYVKWDKKVNHNKEIYVKLIDKKIKAELMGISKDINIKVELEEIENEEAMVSAKMDKN